MNRHLAPVLLSLVVAAGCQREPPPSHIFHTGKIVTVDPQFRTVEAMAIRDGRIVATGTNADILRLAGSDTRAGRSRRQDGAAGADRFPRPCAGRVDVRVRAACPGHGEHRGRPRVLPGARRDDRSRALDHAVPGLHHAPPRAALSDPRRARQGGAQASGRLPHRAGRLAELMALSMSGIDAKFKVPDGEPCRVERDASGQPTGILRNCGRYIRSGSGGSSPTDADRLARLRELLADYNSVGITSIVDANADQSGLELYRTLLAAERADVPHVPGLRRGRPGAARPDRSGDSRGRVASAAPAQRHAVAAGHQGVPGWRHADRQRLHAPAVGRQQDLLDRRSRVPRRPVHRAGEALPDRQARPRERPAVHGPFAGRRGGRCHGRGLRAHQPRRLSGARPAAEHHARQLHEPRKPSRRCRRWASSPTCSRPGSTSTARRFASTSASSGSPTSTPIARSSSRA